MSMDDAIAAVEGAIASDEGFAPPAAPAPADQAPAPASDATPQGSPAVTPAPAEDSFTKADLTALLSGVDDTAARERIEQAYKSFQADYTRKTQEISEQRKQYEALGSVDEAQDAVELYRRLQDPTNWSELHTELSDAMQTLGLSPAQAAAAIQDMEPEPVALPDLTEVDDPGLAPYTAHIDALRNELADVRSAMAAQREAEQEQLRDLAVLGELQRQENILRESYKYGDEDIDFTWKLGQAYGGNMLDAQAEMERYFTARLERYLQQKAAVSASVPSPVASGPVARQAPRFASMEDAEKAAIAHLEQLEAAGAELTF